MVKFRSGDGLVLSANNFYMSYLLITFSGVDRNLWCHIENNSESLLVVFSACPENVCAMFML